MKVFHYDSTDVQTGITTPGIGWIPANAEELSDLLDRAVKPETLSDAALDRILADLETLSD